MSDYTPTEQELIEGSTVDEGERRRGIARIKAEAIREACDCAGRATRNGGNPFIALLDEAERIEQEAGL